MKIRNYTALFIVLLGIGACQKDPVTIPVSFTSTTYQSLSTYDSTGKPSNLLSPRDTISTGVKATLTNYLTEQTDLRKTHPELLSNTAIADIAITQPSEVVVTYVSETTSTANAVAFYTYPTNNPPDSAKDIKEITYIFPNAGKGTKLKAGDKVKIGNFNAGTSIGFVLLEDAWNPDTRTLNNTAVHFCSNDVLNPEVDPNLKKHAVLISYPAENKVLVGFEDRDRTKPNCDHDFNDVVIYATVTH